MASIVDLLGAATFTVPPLLIGYTVRGPSPHIADISVWLVGMAPGVLMLPLLGFEGGGMLAAALLSVPMALLLIWALRVLSANRRRRFLVSCTGEGDPAEILVVIENVLKLKGMERNTTSPPIFPPDVSFLVGPADAIGAMTWLGFRDPIGAASLRLVRQEIRERIRGRGRVRGVGFSLAVAATGPLFGWAYLFLL